MKTKDLDRTQHREAHVAPVKFGRGNFYGSGIRAKVGRMRDSYVTDHKAISEAQKNQPPKSLA